MFQNVFFQTSQQQQQHTRERDRRLEEVAALPAVERHPGGEQVQVAGQARRR